MIITDAEQLKQECEDASIFEAPEIIKRLEYELANSTIPGIGLAAPQIGIKKKVLIARYGNFKLDLVNPVIVDQSDLREFDGEGCLSFPQKYLTTARYNEIYIKDDLHYGLVLTGFHAVICAHECDHLYGITMFDRQIKRPGRNEKCWCGSGKKYKVCHNNKVIRE